METTAQTAPKNKGGRPPLAIDTELLASLAKIHCTYQEMAAILNCSIDTLRDRFSHVIKKAQEEGKASLRRMQYLKAEEGNVTMQIWLGKQLLQQSDRIEELHTNQHVVIND